MFDGEIAAEYFGGILAGSRTPDGKNDTAVSWASALASMSGMQIKLDFLLYREWAALLHERKDLNLAATEGRNSARLLLNFPELLLTLGEPRDLDSVERIETVIAEFEIAAAGLHRLGLIDHFRCGVAAHDSGPWGQATSYFTPTAPGFELYGWAQGVPNMSARAFSTKAAVFDTEPPTARLQGAVLATPPPSQPNQT